MIQVKDQVILYERVQEEYDEFIEQLVLEGVLSCEQLHELTLKTLILELVINELYTKEELKNLMKAKKPLGLLHRLYTKKYKGANDLLIGIQLMFQIKPSKLNITLVTFLLM